MPNSSVAAVQARLREYYSKVAGDLLEPLLHFATVARRVQGGDSDKVLIMMVVAVRTLQHPDFAEPTPAAMARGAAPVLPSLGVNIRSIAESTGMAKETVRRKVGELVNAGFVVRRGGDVRLTAKGYEASTPAKEAFERLAARTYLTMSQLMAGLEAGEPPAPSIGTGRPP